MSQPQLSATTRRSRLRHERQVRAINGSHRAGAGRSCLVAATLLAVVGCKGPRVGPPLDAGLDAGGGHELGDAADEVPSRPAVTFDGSVEVSTRSETSGSSRVESASSSSEPRETTSELEPFASEVTLASTRSSEIDTEGGPSNPVDTESAAATGPAATSSAATATFSAQDSFSTTSSPEGATSSSNDDSSDALVITVEGDLQTAVDEAPDGAVLELPAGDLAANVVVESQRITFRCSTRGTTYWRSALATQPALRASFESEIVVERCVFENSDGGVSPSDQSGAILIEGPKRLEVYDSVFRYNAAHRGPVAGNYQSGIGEFVDPDGLIRFQNNVMLYNHADDGGVIYISNSTHIELVNNLIYGNWADDYGAAVWLRNQTRDDLVFARNTVVGNDAVRAAGLVTLSGDGANINSSLIAENTPNNIANDWPQAFSLVTDYAPLVDPAAGDFRLVGGSSAIDGGDPSWFDDDGTRADQGVDLALLPMDLLE